MIKKIALISGLVASAFAAGAQAEAGDWLGRARIINVAPQESSTALNLGASNEMVPELDFSYFITRNIAAELILATTNHDISAGGTKIGNAKLLPPTLTVQYHFMPDSSSFRPYIGAGVNYTRFYGVNLSGGTLTVDKRSWGPALQAGVDIPLNNKFFFNFDVKKVWIDTDVKNVATGAKLSTFKLNPWIVGAGIGMKF